MIRRGKLQKEMNSLRRLVRRKGAVVWPERFGLEEALHFKYSEEVDRAIQGGLARIPRQEADLLRHFFGIHEGRKTAREIASLFGLPEGKIWALKVKALRDLEHEEAFRAEICTISPSLPPSA